MKCIKLLSVVLIFINCLNVLAQTQPCDGLYYFHENRSITCWTGFAGIYKGGDATFTTCNSNAIPIEDGALKFEVSKTTGWWNTLLYVGGGESANWLWYGNAPVLNFDVKWVSGSNDLEIEVNDKNDKSASVYLKSYVSPSPGYQTVSIPITTFLAKNPDMDFSRISFIRILGYGNWGEYTASTILLKNIVVTNQANCKYSEMVKVNQLGYLPDMPKFAIVGFQAGTQTAPATFTLKDASTDAVVFTGTLTKRNTFNAEWKRSGDDVYYGDFSSFKTPGSYYINVASLSQRSSNFNIASTVYNNAFRSALRFFYYARSGEEIIEPFAENFTRPGYYMNDNEAPYESNANKTGTRDVRGGWFDAGDPHKDMHAQPITMFMLLETLEDFELKIKTGNLNIPNTSDDKSDLYYLVKYQLDWIKKLWNDDGSVQMWVESPNNSIKDNKCLVSDVSTFSASTLALTYAKAYRSFKQLPAFSTYADSMLIMAEKSWQWLKVHPANYNPLRPSGIDYSYYKNARQDSFMRMNAAVELYETTGKDEYHTYFKNTYNKLYSQDWYDWQLGSIPAQIQNDWGSFAYYEYIFSRQSSVDVSIQNELKQRYIKLADWLKYRGNNVEYSPAIAAPNHIFWGSNGLLMGNIYTLVKVYEFTNDVSYLHAAYENLHWVLGRNPVNTCMLSGFGTKSTYFFSGYWTNYMNQPHGYMTGGINEFYMEEYIPEPWKRYMFIHAAPWLEPGIYWQAEACWALGYFASASGPVNIDEAKNAAESFVIYPNPASNEFTVEMKNNKGTVNVEIINLIGQVVFKENFIDKTTIPIGNFAPGVYLVRLETGKTVEVKKIIKE